MKLIGANFVEVARIYDDAGGITALAAAEIANSLLKLTAKMPVQATT
jgi:arginase family enzyme